MRGISISRAIVFLFAYGALAVGRSQAVVITLTDQNSVSQFDTSSQAGQFNWRVDGVNQLAQQWFWYRIGPNGGEHSIDTLSAPVVNQPTASDFDATYTGAQVQIKTTYSLLGGSPGSGTSDIAEQIRIKNLTGTVLDLHFYQYVDFDLNGTLNDDVVQFTNANAVLQREGAISLAETVDTITGAASTHREVNTFPNTLNKLNDGLPTTLNDNLGPLFGPADLTWGFEWDFLIAPNSTVLISKDKNLIVPEPTTLGLLALASGFALRRRRIA